MPITWRNIENDPTQGSALLFETALRSFNDGMGKFQGIVDSRNELNQQNWDTQKEVNTDQFLDRLAQFKTPEELAAAQQAGQLQALKAQFGAQIDRDAVRDAEVAAAEQLMRRITAQNQYADDKINRDARPDIDHFYDLVGQGRLKEAAQWKAEKQLGVDESSLTNVLLDRNDKQFSQSMEKSRLALQQAEEHRKQIDWNDKWAEINQNRMAVDLGDQALKGATSFADARTAFLASAKEKGLRDDVVNKGLDNLQASYQARTGLTTEQDEWLNSQEDVIAANSQAAKDKEALARSRYNDDKVWQTTVDDAIAGVFPRVEGEEDNTAIKIRGMVKAYEDKFKDELGGMNIGPALEQTLKGLGINEETFTDDVLNTSGFDKALKRNVEEMLAYNALRSQAKTSAAAAEQLRLKKRLGMISGNIGANLK